MDMCDVVTRDKVEIKISFMKNIKFFKIKNHLMLYYLFDIHDLTKLVKSIFTYSI